MKISFVIPAHNEEKIIGKCLKSVQRELAKTKDPATGGPVDAEVFVVNNASTDGTREAALKFKGVSVVDEPLKGLVLARRAGFVVSTGDIVANIDADTMLPQGWLLKVMKSFEEDPQLAALSGPFTYHDISWYQRAMVNVFYFFGFLFYFVVHYGLHAGAMLQGGNYVVRRNALNAIGGYDTNIAFYGEDTDIAKRLTAVGEVRWTFFLPIYASGRRVHKEGIVPMGLRYMVNFFAVNFFGKPVHTKYKDIRVD